MQLASDIALKVRRGAQGDPAGSARESHEAATHSKVCTCRSVEVALFSAVCASQSMSIDAGPDRG